MHIWEVHFHSNGETTVVFVRCETSLEAKRLALNEVRARTNKASWEVVSCLKCV